MVNIVTNKKFLIITNILLLSTVVLLIVLKKTDADEKKVGIVTRDVNDEYKLTNPILDYENLVSGEGSVIPIGRVNDKVNDLEKEKGISLISLYYRDLNNGQWIGVNEKEDFYPASLLKVPTMIAFLKSVESNEEILNKRVLVKNSD